jgi:hypothetical protein
MLHVLDKVPQHTIAALRFFGSSPVRLHPGLARRIGAMRKVHGVPKFRRHEFSRVVVNADQSAALRRQALHRFVESAVRRFVARAHIQLRPKRIPSHVKDVQQTSVPKGLFVHAHLHTFIQVYRNPEPAERKITLRTPGATRLPVADRLPAEDAFQVRDARLFTPLELERAFHEAEAEQILGWCRYGKSLGSRDGETAWDASAA